MAMAMATAMAFSIPVLPVYQSEKVEAAKVTPAEATSALDVKVSEVDETATVELTDGAADVLYFAITTQAKLDKGTYPSASAYEAVEYKAGGTSIDLSWVNRKKEQVLCVATGSSVAEIKPVTTTLKAQDTLVATYTGTITEDKGNVVGDSTNGYLTLNKGTKKDPTPVSAGAVQYRTTNSKWEGADKLEENLARYTTKGTTLQMRVAPNENTPAGKIINVKIKAKAKAPNVTVNYNDKTVSVPAKVQYSVDKGTTWSEAADKKEAKNIGEYGWDGTTDKTVYFRTAGDSKKASSKIKYVTIKKEDTSFAKLVAPVSGAAVIADVESGKLDVRFKTAYLATSGLVFTNTTDNIYQVALAKKTDLEGYTVDNTLNAASSSAIVAKSAGKVKWTTVKAQTAAKAGTATVATKSVNLDEYVILYRICDTKGATVNSEVRMFDVPGTVKQSVVLSKTSVEIAADTKATTSSAVVTVSGSGLVAASPKYTVAAYSNEACTTKYTNLTLTYKDGELKVASKAKTEAGTYYVKVTAEGTNAVLTVVVK